MFQRTTSLLLFVLVGALVVGRSGATLADEATGTITGTVAAKPSKFLPETVVYLQNVTGKSVSAKKRTIEMNQEGLQFVPHILIIEIGDTVKFLNSDKVDHNVMSPDGEKYDLGTWGEGQAKSRKFKKAGVYSTLCQLHPEMHAFIFVGQNRYAAIVDASGSFTIDKVPAGTYQLAIWNSHLKAPSQPITVESGKTQKVQFKLKR